MMPTMMPKVGRGNKSNVYYNTGHGHLGWTLSACTAEMIGDVIQYGETSKVTGPSTSLKFS
jgi:D-amino-acid dehydrogenase